MLCQEEVIHQELISGGYVLGEFAKDMIILTEGMTEMEKKSYKDEMLFEKLVELREHCD